MTTITEGKTAPAFALADTEGRKHTLEEMLKTGPAVLAFYKVSCPVCQFTFPFLERIHRACASDKARVIGISQDDAQDSREFMQEFGLSFPSLVDESGYPVSNAYGLTYVPTVLLVAPDGKVQVSCVGFGKKELEQISAEMARASGRPPAPVFLPGESVPDYKPG
jgi:peroxiredoxin